MNITIKATKFLLSPETEAIVEEKLAAPLRLLGEKGDTALLEVEVQEAPPEGRSSEPYRLVARLTIEGRGEVFHAEAVKPTPESAADKVRAELEAEIRKSRGRTRRLVRRGASAIKDMLRFGR
jgi:ribosome-associated translation inhibitor RaiA